MAELAAHARHDLTRVAGSLDRGASLAPMMDLCARCAGLYADLVALAAALPLVAVPARPRDFRLTAVDARRLRSNGWRSWWTILGSGRDSLTRPLAIGFTTLGLAGLLLTAAPAVVPMAGSSAGASAAPPVPLDREVLPLQSGDPTVVAVAGDPGGDATAPPGEVAGDPVATATVSAGLLGLGIGLLAARRIATHGRRVR